MATELQIMIHAKTYLDKLANGIDPLTDQPLPETDIVNQVRISRCLYCVSDVLGAVLQNGGPRRPQEPDLPPFAPEQIDLSRFELSEQPMPVTVLVGKINALKPQQMKKLKITAVTNWLTMRGFLHTETVNGKQRRRPTPKGFEIGITEREKVNDFGVKYFSVLYTVPAQRFVLDNLSALAAEGFNDSRGELIGE